MTTKAYSVSVRARTDPDKTFLPPRYAITNAESVAEALEKVCKFFGADANEVYEVRESHQVIVP
jgi:hypothetical protein